MNFAEDYDSRKYSPRTFSINAMLSMFDGTLRHDDGLLLHLCGWQLRRMATAMYAGSELAQCLVLVLPPCE